MGDSVVCLISYIHDALVTVGEATIKDAKAKENFLRQDFSEPCSLNTCQLEWLEWLEWQQSISPIAKCYKEAKYCFNRLQEKYMSINNNGR